MGIFGSKDKITKEDMDFLKSHTCFDEPTIKEYYKGFKKDCPDGMLKPEKFAGMYKTYYSSDNAEGFCDHVFRAFDIDGNGYIDFKEYLQGINIKLNGTPEEKFKWMVRIYDDDGDGVINIQKITKFVQAIYNMLGASSNRPADSAEECARKIFGKMIENNGQLTQEVFLRVCLQDEELSEILAL